MSIAIIDYQMGNLFSVKNACDFLGLESEITSDPEKIVSSKGVILPGVGAFGKAMDNLENTGLKDAVLNTIETNTPFLGICLGMQLLFSESDEFGAHKGLEVIEGSVRHFTKGELVENTPVPNVGWCKIQSEGKNWEGTVFDGIYNGEYMYFTHSHYTEPVDDSVAITYTEYGGFKYCSAIQKGNITATQFHPEKSSKFGLELLRNFGKSLS